MILLFFFFNLEGYVEEKDEIMGEVMEARIVLKAIENSIVVFSLFVKTEELDPHKPWWRIRSVKLSFQPLEDPRDFNLLCDITNSIQKVTICNWTHTHARATYLWKMMHLPICPEEKGMDKRVGRNEVMVQVERKKDAERMWWPEERDYVYDNRNEIGDKGAQDEYSINISTQMV